MLVHCVWVVPHKEVAELRRESQPLDRMQSYMQCTWSAGP